MEVLYWALEIAAFIVACFWVLQHLIPGLYVSVARMVIDDVPWSGSVMLFALPLMVGIAARELSVVPAECAATGMALGALLRVAPAFGRHSLFTKRQHRIGLTTLLLIFVAGYYSLGFIGFQFAEGADARGWGFSSLVMRFSDLLSRWPQEFTLTALTNVTWLVGGKILARVYYPFRRDESPIGGQNGSAASPNSRKSGRPKGAGVRR